MNLEDISKEDLVTIKVNGSYTDWEDQNSSDGESITGLVLNDPKILGVVLVATYGRYNNLSYTLDEDGCIDYGISKDYLGYNVSAVRASKVHAVEHTPIKVGKKILKYSFIEDGLIVRLYNDASANAGHLPDNVQIKEFQIIGSVFDTSLWQYIYCLLMPDASKYGYPLGSQSIDCYKVDDKYRGKIVCTIPASFIDFDNKKTTRLPPRGLSCMNKHCRIFSEWVDEPNCPNNVFLCYSCKTNPITYTIVMAQYEQ